MSTSFATADDRARLGVLGNAFAELDPSDVDGALSAASDLAAGYLRRRYKFPLSAWGDDLRLNVVQIADWLLMKKRGFNPDAAGDAAVRLSQEDAVQWLNRVALGTVDPDGIVDSTPDTTETRDVVVRSQPRRGW